MTDSAIAAAQRAIDSLDASITLVPDDWDVLVSTSVSAAREAFTAVQGVLDRLEYNTQPPCGPEETSAARVDALEAIARLVQGSDHAAPVTTALPVAPGRDALRASTPEDLESLPDGAVYVSDMHPDVPETKARGLWWTPDHDPFEPALPGTVVYIPTDQAN